MTTRFFLSRQQVFDDAGNPSSGALLDFYETGTSTPKATYSDAALTVANANPVVADSAGRFGDIFLDTGDYKARLRTSAGTVVWTADPVQGDTSTAAASVPTGRNLIINGAFAVNQRGATSVADDAYCLDRWYVLAQSGNVTVAQQTVQEFAQPNNIRLTQPDSSAKRIGLAQIVEAADSRGYRNTFLTLSARIRCSVAQPIRYAVLAWDGTADSVTSDVVLDWTSTSYSAGGFFLASNLSGIATGTITPSAGVWTDITPLEFDMPNAGNNIIVMFWTSGTLAQNATLDIGLVQLEPGQEANDFVRPSIAETLAQCQRYFYQTGAARLLAAYAGGANSTTLQALEFPVAMRVAPTASATWASGTNNSSQSVTNIAPEGCQLSLISITSGDFSVTYSAGNTFSAEI
jgi:hypothetical protein